MASDTFARRGDELPRRSCPKHGAIADGVVPIFRTEHPGMAPERSYCPYCLENAIRTGSVHTLSELKQDHGGHLMDEKNAKQLTVEQSVMIGVRVRGGHVSFQEPIALVRDCTFIDCTLGWGSGAGGDCGACYWGATVSEGRYSCACSFKSDHPPVTGCYRWRQRGT